MESRADKDLHPERERPIRANAEVQWDFGGESFDHGGVARASHVSSFVRLKRSGLLPISRFFLLTLRFHFRLMAGGFPRHDLLLPPHITPLPCPGKLPEI